MIISRKHVGMVIVLALGAGATPALAQTPIPNLPAPTVLPALPAEEGGAMVEPPPAMQGRVPALPASRACAPEDVRGLWKLLQVYEEPTGPETAVFYSLPSQYYRFKADGLLGVLEKDKDVSMNIRQINGAIDSQNKGLQQFVAQEGGQLYFYRDGVAVKQQACFIVVTATEHYAKGQMLLMPPNTQSPTRWVKVYTKIFTDAPKRRSAPKAAPPAMQEGTSLQPDPAKLGTQTASTNNDDSADDDKPANLYDDRELMAQSKPTAKEVRAQVRKQHAAKKKIKHYKRKQKKLHKRNKRNK